MLHIGSPELLSFSIFGLCMVAALSVGTPLRGLAAAAFGLLLAMIGADPQTSTQRWTLGTFYLWDGLPLVPVTLGLFALPELADMAIERRSIAGEARVDVRSGQMQGVRDTLTHWWLVIRVAWLGAALGAVPGLGAAVIDWIAYGHAARTEKGASESFGHGDIRGVLASEGANNAKEGGALVPTIAFGVPGSASMAILLGAFLVHGLQPGPDMLTRHLDVTYSIIWSVALANILGAGICFAFANQFARISLIRQPVIMPLILTVIMVGAYQGSRQWGDLYALVGFGALGWLMKRQGWPRPPLILGFVLGGIVERYLFISVERYGTDWLASPIVIILLLLAIWGFVRPLMREVRAAGGAGVLLEGYSARLRLDGNTLFYLAALILVGAMMIAAAPWQEQARLVPQVVGGFALTVLAASLLVHTFRDPGASRRAASAEVAATTGLRLDVQAREEGPGRRVRLTRAGVYLAWLVGFLAVVSVIGMLPAIFVFVIAYMRGEGRERWPLTLSLSAGMTVFCYVVFDRLLALPWPRTVIGGLVPELAKILPSL